MKQVSLKKLLQLETILSILCLFLPFVWMKIGPQGYINYGPTVPDIYIFGGYIFGKDTSWWGINFAYKFQLITVLTFAFSALLCYLNTTNHTFIINVQAILSILLLLFPMWLWFYTGGVHSNSDGADLSIYPHIGWIAYIGLVFLQILIYRQLKKKKKHGI